jgi:hypothetical protein
MSKTRLSFQIPSRGKRPSTFRRKLVAALREEAGAMYGKGMLDADLLEEIYRAIPIEGPRQ